MKFRIYESLPPRHGNLTNHPLTRFNMETTSAWMWAAIQNAGEWVEVDVRDISDRGRLGSHITEAQWANRARNIKKAIRNKRPPFDQFDGWEYEWDCFVRDRTTLFLMAPAEE